MPAPQRDTFLINHGVSPKKHTRSQKHASTHRVSMPGSRHCRIGAHAAELIVPAALP